MNADCALLTRANNRRTVALAASLVAAALLCTSCAFTDKRNRPLLNLCERHLVAEDTTTRALTAPLVIPACVVAWAVDAVVVHPATVVDDAWYDTELALWQPAGRGYATECALVPLRAGLTPVVWSLQFLSRSVFLRAPWPPSPARLERQLTGDDPEMRLLAARSLTWASYQGDDAKPATDAMIRALAAYPKDPSFGAAVILRLPAPLTAEARNCLAELGRKGRGRRPAAALERLLLDCLHSPKDGPDFLAAVFDDLVTAGHHEAEAALVQLLVYNLQSGRPGLEALALHVCRSEARRGWPGYAAGVAFPLQLELLALSPAAWIEAVDYEWPAIRVRPDWPGAVMRSLSPPAAVRDASGNIIPPPPRDVLRAALLRQQNALSQQLQETARNRPSLLLKLTRDLLDVKTTLDALDAADRLLKAPPSDLLLFSGNPLDIMCKQEEP